MDWMTTVQEWRWDVMGSVIAALAGAIWSVYTFTRERREDRKWRQVEFLLDANQKFFDNPEIRQCVRKLDDTHQHEDLERVLRADRARLTAEDVKLVEEFRSLFQFFDSLAHCLRMDALTLEQVSLFGLYLQKIGRSEVLRHYCEENGFGDVVDLAIQVERHAYARG
jgi:hypothetical protein